MGVKTYGCITAQVPLTHIALYLGSDGGAALVDDGVHLLGEVQENVIGSVLHARPPPGHVTQLAGGQRHAHARGGKANY